MPGWGGWRDCEIRRRVKLVWGTNLESRSVLGFGLQKDFRRFGIKTRLVFRAGEICVVVNANVAVG